MTALDATRAAFLADVIAHPDDDTPRLIFADWLEEHGEKARAEFIRRDVADGGLCQFRTGSEAAVILQWGEGTRLHAQCVFIAPAQERVSYTVRRGFVEAVTLPAADWLAHADALYWHPEQTNECPDCDGKGNVCGDPWYSCRTCKDGRVPRPCPKTAHPIREVRLTTWPGRQGRAAGFDLWVMQPEWGPAESLAEGGFGEADLFENREALVRRFLYARWPLVTFRLPEQKSHYSSLFASPPAP